MAQDLFSPPSDADDPQHEESDKKIVVRQRALADSIERGERPSMALAFQIPGAPPRFSYRATGDGLDGYLASAAVLLATVQMMRDHVSNHVDVARVKWACDAEADGACSVCGYAGDDPARRCAFCAQLGDDLEPAG